MRERVNLQAFLLTRLRVVLVLILQGGARTRRAGVVQKNASLLSSAAKAQHIHHSDHDAKRQRDVTHWNRAGADRANVAFDQFHYRRNRGQSTGYGGSAPE